MDTGSTPRRARRTLRTTLRNVLLALIVLAPAGLVASPASAASWPYSYTVGAADCPSSGAYPIAGSVWFADYNTAWGWCNSNGTTTNSDADLRNDYFNDGSPMAPGFNYVGQSIAPTGQSVTIWQSTGCSGTKQTVTMSFTTSVNYYSYKRNSSANGS